MSQNKGKSYLAEQFRQIKRSVAELFRQIKRSVAELFRQIKRSVTEQFRQMKRSVAEHYSNINFNYYYNLCGLRGKNSLHGRLRGYFFAFVEMVCP